MSKLDELQRLCDEATPEWKVSAEGDFIRAIVDSRPGYGISCNPADAKFIAAARTYMPLLISVARAAERRLEVWTRDTYLDLQNTLAALEQEK